MRGDTRVIPIVENEDDEIQWACSTSIYTDAGEPETLKEAMTRPNGNLWKISVVSKRNGFLSRKVWIPTNRCVVNSKCINPVRVKLVLNIKEDHEGLIFLK